MAQVSKVPVSRLIKQGEGDGASKMSIDEYRNSIELTISSSAQLIQEKWYKTITCDCFSTSYILCKVSLYENLIDFLEIHSKLFFSICK